MNITTPGNRAVQIEITRSEAGTIYLDCTVPSLNIQARAYRVLPLKTPKSGATHYLDAGQTPIGIDAATAKMLTEAINALEQDYWRSPAGQVEHLRRERRALVDEKGTCLDNMSAARERAVHGSTSVEWDKARRYEIRANAAQAQIVAFDLAHPEIIAAITAERDAATARFLAND